MKKVKTLLRDIGAVCLFAAAGIMITAMYWAHGQFGEVDFATVIFHLKQPLEGADSTNFTQGIIWGILSGICFAAAGIILKKVLSRQGNIILRLGKREFRIPLDIFRRRFGVWGLCFCLVGLYTMSEFFCIPDYVKSQIQQSKLYDEYYVDPETADISFPEERRNLIYIYMESMENTFMSVEEGGMEYANFIPEMTELQLENINFASSGSINGAISTNRTGWTASALMAQTCGVTCSLPIDANSVEDYSDVFLGAYSLGEILDEQGYNQEFLMGSDGDFAGRKSFFEIHGNYEIKDYYYAIEQGWIPEDYFVWWGYEDQKLYEFAKQELLELSEQEEPFNLTMLTVDTHFVGGHICELCDDTFGEDNYANVIACASRQVTEFVEWIQQQDFYENTTIIICGDHPTMDTAYMEESTGDNLDGYTRKVYTTVINSAVDYELDYDRTFTTMDMYPTTLASLGADIEGDRLGLGTNLFSDTPTLVEIMGIETLNAEIIKASSYYENNILYGD